MNNPKNIKIHTDLSRKLVKLGVFEEFLECCNQGNLQHTYVKTLYECFEWETSKQGYGFWQGISIKILEIK